jgi:hypothetical protein
MRTRFLTVALTLASVFGVQQAAAKKYTKDVATSKKHHKKHTGKTGTASRTAPPAKAAPTH